MNAIRVSATSARNNLFGLLDQVLSGFSVVIEKDKKAIARVVPIATKTRNKGLFLSLKKAAKGFVYNKKDNPLRKLGSADFLGKWDR